MHFCLCGWNISTWFNLWCVNNNIWLWFVFILCVSLLAFFLSYDTIVGCSTAWRKKRRHCKFGFESSSPDGHADTSLVFVHDAYLPLHMELFHFLPSNKVDSILKRLYCCVAESLSTSNFTKFRAKKQKTCLYLFQVEAVYRTYVTHVILKSYSCFITC